MPGLVEIDLGQRLGFGLLGCMVNGRAGLKIRADVGGQETGRDRGDDYGDAASLQVGQGYGGLAGSAFLDGPGFSRADGEVTTEEGDVFRQVEMPIDDGQGIGLLVDAFMLQCELRLLFRLAWLDRAGRLGGFTRPAEDGLRYFCIRTRCIGRINNLRLED